jgi:hypothetical protein
MTAPEPSAACPADGVRTAAQQIVAALSLPLSPAPAEPLRPLPLIGLHQLSRDTTMLYGVGRVDASGRVSNREIVRALGWQPGDKLEVIPALGGIVILSSPDGLLSVPLKPYIVIPAAARLLHNIEAGDHVCGPALRMPMIRALGTPMIGDGNAPPVVAAGRCGW